MTDNGSKLSAKQQRALSALLTSKTVGEAALATGLGERTIYRWLTEPAFRQALSAAEGVLIDAATRRLLQLQTAALDVFESLLAKDAEVSASVQLRAATAATDYLLKLRELRDIEQRLQVLEQRFTERDIP